METLFLTLIVVLGFVINNYLWMVYKDREREKPLPYSLKETLPKKGRVKVEESPLKDPFTLGKKEAKDLLNKLSK